MSVIDVPSVRPSIPNPLTPEFLIQLESEGLYELVDGRLVDKVMGFLANEVAGEITRILGNFVKAEKMRGFVLPEQTFQCFDHAPDRVRRPDVAFIFPSRVPEIRPAGHVRIVPDLAVEVLSPADIVYDLDENLADYRLAGVPMTWVVNPEARVVGVHRPAQPIVELYDGDDLRGDPVLPGFAVNVTDLFPPRSSKVESPAMTSL